jgi:hypothetical protein
MGYVFEGISSTGSQLIAINGEEKRLKPFKKCVEGCLLIPRMNPGVNLNWSMMTEQIYVNTRLQPGGEKSPRSTQNPFYVNTRLQSGDGKTCGEGVACAFPIPLYVSTRLQSGGEKSPIPTQNRFNGFRVKRLKPFGNGVVVCALSNPWMNPGANLNVNSMTEQIYVSTPIHRGDGKSSISTQNRFNGLLFITNKMEKK